MITGDDHAMVVNNCNQPAGGLDNLGVVPWQPELPNRAVAQTVLIDSRPLKATVHFPKGMPEQLTPREGQG